MQENREEIKEDPFAHFLFGSKKRNEEKSIPEVPEESTEKNTNLNLDEIIIHVDTLMESAHKLKPLFSTIQPLFEKFINKK